MADTNPHNIGTDKVIVSLTALQRYHHQLLEALGLVQDTAAYQYKGTRKDDEGNPEFKPASISAAIDSIYDLAKLGGVTFGEGKSTDAKSEPIMFTDDNSKSDNIVYINAKVGDNTFNIGLDTSKFVKDSVLKSVFLLNVAGTDTKTYKTNGVTATFSTDDDGNDTLGEFNVAKTDVEKLGEGTYFYYTWITDNGEAGKAYSYTCISLKDVYGDIKGDDAYINYNKETATISANTADVTSKIVDPEEKSVKFQIIPHDGRILVYEQIGDGEYSDKSFEEIDGTLTDKTSVKSLLAEHSYDLPDEGWDFPESGDVVAYGSQLIGGQKTWEVDPDAESDTNLATAENLANVASDLQNQIDTLAQGTLTAGDITLSDEITKSNIDVANNKINITLAVASETDINALFQNCVDGATSIAPTSSVNGGAPITAPGEYTINVGEDPEGATTDITWTKQD